MPIWVPTTQTWPEATAAAFHGDWFRTGDLAVRDPDGYFTIGGRINDRIRRAGENIAANEVEAVLDELPGLLESAALPVSDLLRGEEVMACLVQKLGEPETSPEEVIAHCVRNLAAYKIPRYLAFRTTPLPRTASGKIAKQLLRDEAPAHPSVVWDRMEVRWRPVRELLHSESS